MAMFDLSDEIDDGLRVVVIVSNVAEDHDAVFDTKRGMAAGTLQARLAALARPRFAAAVQTAEPRDRYLARHTLNCCTASITSF